MHILALRTQLSLYWSRSREVWCHSSPPRWPGFEYWIDTKNFNFLLCPLPCFSRLVKLLIPRWSGREDLTVVAGIGTFLLYIFFTAEEEMWSEVSYGVLPVLLWHNRSFFSEMQWDQYVGLPTGLNAFM